MQSAALISVDGEEVKDVEGGHKVGIQAGSPSADTLEVNEFGDVVGVPVGQITEEGVIPEGAAEPMEGSYEALGQMFRGR